MRDAEKFKLGFFLGLAKMGMTPSDLTDILTKRAAWAGAAASGAYALSKKKLLGMLAAGLGAAAVAGVGGGYAAHKILQSERQGYDEFRDEELEQWYRNAARRVREQRQLRERGEEAVLEPPKWRIESDPRRID